MKNEMFYDSDEISPELDKIKTMHSEIVAEVNNIDNNNSDWKDWPEKSLYANNGKWKIFPFYAFGTWDNENCNRCPNITKFLKSINGLKLATLSKLSPKMKLIPHKGWANHSNNVIRCHYGIKVPTECYISVKDNNVELIKYHSEKSWLCFDDSKEHYAENKSDTDRIVLIVDIERPENIETGVSDVEDSSELLEIVDHFKKKNGDK